MLSVAEAVEAMGKDDDDDDDEDGGGLQEVGTISTFHLQREWRVRDRTKEVKLHLYSRHDTIVISCGSTVYWINCGSRTIRSYMSHIFVYIKVLRKKLGDTYLKIDSKEVIHNCPLLSI